MIVINGLLFALILTEQVSIYVVEVWGQLGELGFAQYVSQISGIAQITIVEEKICIGGNVISRA